MKFVPLEGRASEVELRALKLMKDKGHPHLVRLFGAWEKDHCLMLAMELADCTLEDRLQKARDAGQVGIPPGELLKYMREAAEGLDYLNSLPVQKGIQHRDVKPKNLLLKGGGVLVADFGLAKLLEHTRTSHTGDHTPQYAAPEFFRKKATRHSDQYSLAVTYCKLRGGRLPFTGDAAAVMMGHLKRKPNLSMLPEAERGPVAKALAKKPKERWPSCREFVEALAPFLSPTPPSAAAAPTEVVNFLGMRFVRIEPGTFLMGSPESEKGRDNGETQHRVTLTRGFYAGVHQVTRG